MSPRLREGLKSDQTSPLPDQAHSRPTRDVPAAQGPRFWVSSRESPRAWLAGDLGDLPGLGVTRERPFRPPPERSASVETLTVCPSAELSRAGNEGLRKAVLFLFLILSGVSGGPGASDRPVPDPRGHPRGSSALPLGPGTTEPGREWHEWPSGRVPCPRASPGGSWACASLAMPWAEAVPR